MGNNTKERLFEGYDAERKNKKLSCKDKPYGVAVEEDSCCKSIKKKHPEERYSSGAEEEIADSCCKLKKERDSRGEEDSCCKPKCNSDDSCCKLKKGNDSCSEEDSCCKPKKERDSCCEEDSCRKSKEGCGSCTEVEDSCCKPKENGEEEDSCCDPKDRKLLDNNVNYAIYITSSAPSNII